MKSLSFFTIAFSFNISPAKPHLTAFTKALETRYIKLFAITCTYTCKPARSRVNNETCIFVWTDTISIWAKGVGSDEEDHSYHPCVQMALCQIICSRVCMSCSLLTVVAWAELKVLLTINGQWTCRTFYWTKIRFGLVCDFSKPVWKLIFFIQHYLSSNSPSPSLSVSVNFSPVEMWCKSPFQLWICAIEQGSLCFSFMPLQSSYGLAWSISQNNLFSYLPLLSPQSLFFCNRLAGSLWACACLPCKQKEAFPLR